MTEPRTASAWSPLRHRVFLAIFIAQLASNLGTLMQSVGSSWLMGDLNATPVLVALVQTATFLPVLLVGIPAGALADIVDRRRLLIGTQLWMMASAGLLAVLSFGGHITKFSLLALTFSLGLGGAVNSPAWQAIQPELVPEEEFGQAIALGSLTYNVGRAVGPALGGLLVAAAGPGWVFTLNAVSFVGTVLVLWRWRPAKASQRLPEESLAGATRGAIRYGANAPILRSVLARVGVLIVPAAAVQALLPIVVRGPLGLGSDGYGILLGCFGVGAVMAALVRPRIVARLTPDQLVVASTVVLALTLVVQGTSRSAWLIGAAVAFGGVAWTSATITLNVAAISVLPSWVRARGMGLYMLVLAGGIAVGSALWGALANVNLRNAHLVAAVCLVASLPANRRWPLSKTIGIDVRSVERTDPMVVFTPQPSDGPVLVTVTYRVDESHGALFADAMRAVERHRRRTGAYQWGLFRDLGKPDEFLETFHVSSWVEHLRQHERGLSPAMSEVARFRVSETPPTHHISAYSTGALGPLVPHDDAADVFD